MKKLILAAALLGLTACQGTPTYQDAATANDVATEATVMALCSPLRLPALYRKYSDQPEKLAAIQTLCRE